MEKSKETILSRIKKNKPEPSPLPEIPDFDVPDGALTDLFAEVLEKVGGKVIPGVPAEAIEKKVNALFPEAQQVWSGVAEVTGSNVAINKGPHQLENLDLVVIRGDIGVAENGAVWVDEKSLPQRVIAFITLHLVIVLDKNEIVWNMHQAYQKIGNKLPGFGLFISGPSKTADIEQSLVIGAQGPKSLTVFIT